MKCQTAFPTKYERAAYKYKNIEEKPPFHTAWSKWPFCQFLFIEIYEYYQCYHVNASNIYQSLYYSNIIYQDLNPKSF